MSDSIDAPVSERTGASFRAASSSAAWAFTAQLHTTLEADKVIRLFAAELQRQVPHDSFQYRHAVQGLEVSEGTAARHSLNYRLILEEQTLGEIVVTRARRFSEGEITTAENLIGGLVYALRNALLYREALQASLSDPLTGVANRAALETTLAREVGLSRRHHLPVSVLMIDIDKFKRINDTHGHALGDAVLKTLTRGVRECIRATDVLARYGGEEFVVILPGTDSAGASHLAGRICRHVADLQCAGSGTAGDVVLQFTVSIGVATLAGPEPGTALLDRADHAMYQAKQQGGNRAAAA